MASFDQFEDQRGRAEVRLGQPRDDEASRGDARIFESAQDQGEGRQAQVGFRLATTGGKEQEVHDFAVGMFGGGDTLQVHQDEGKLERPPCGSCQWSVVSCQKNRRSFEFAPAGLTRALGLEAG